MTIQQTPIQKLPYPQGSDSADVPRDISALALALDPLGYVPVGSMLMWPATTAPTIVDGAGNPLWLLMLGQVVLQTTYPKLAVVLGAADGNITIPDMRDRFPVGAGGTYTAVTSVGGEATHVLALGEMPSHNHNGYTGATDRSMQHAHAYDFDNWQANLGSQTYVSIVRQPNTGPATTATRDAAAPDHFHSIPSNGSGLAHENRPPFRAINFIIRAG